MSSLFYGNRRIFENTEFRRLSGILSGVKCSPGLERYAYRQRRQEPETNGRKCRSISLQETSCINSTAINKKRERISMPAKTSDSVYKLPVSYCCRPLRSSVCNGRAQSYALADEGNLLILHEKAGNTNTKIDPHYKLYIHGYCGVGKSLLLENLVEQFSAENESNVLEYCCEEDAFVSTTVNSRRSILEFHEQDVLQRGNLMDGDIHLVVYALNDKVSMKYAIDCAVNLRWKRKVQSPIVIVGNKMDIVRNRPDLRTDVRFMTEKLGCHHIETSAILNYNMEDLKSAIIKYVNGECPDLKETKRRCTFKTLFKHFMFWNK